MSEAYGKIGVTNGFLADGAITQFAAVVMSTADNDVKISGTKGVFSPGFAQEAAADNAAVTVSLPGGISQAIVNEACVPGDELTVSAALGKEQKAVSTDWVNAVALQTALADGDQIAVLQVGYVKP